MKDKVKKALKRFSSGFMAVLLAVCLVGTPKAKAVVTEGALLGSIFGSLLVSMGFSWAAENMDVPTFGESIYKLIQEHDEANKDTGVQLIRDLSLASLLSGRPGTIQFNYAWTQAARSFAHWFENKFFSSGNSTFEIVQSSGVPQFAYYSDSISGNIYEYPHVDPVASFDGNTLNFYGSPEGQSVDSICFKAYYHKTTSDLLTLSLNSSTIKPRINYVSVLNHKHAYQNLYSSSDLTGTYKLDISSGTWYCNIPKGEEFILRYQINIPSDLSAGTYEIPELPVINEISSPASLSAEKPAEVHYPDVAEDGSQVYEVTYEGVTATDIEGIIQGAVDRILAGTASIVGSVEQAGTVVNPGIDPYKVGLSSVFPFCIPFDVYNMVTMFVAEPEAPHAEWTFSLPWSNQDYSVGWDLSDFDGVAQVCRSMELVLFVVGLAAITHKFIKW